MMLQKRAVMFLVSLMAAFALLAGIICLTIPGVKAEETEYMETNWNQSWYYQTGATPGNVPRNDQGELVGTGETATPSIFQIADVGEETALVTPTPIEGYKMTFTFLPGADATHYNQDNTYKDRSFHELMQIFLLPTPTWYNNSALNYDVGYGVFAWPDNNADGTTRWGGRYVDAAGMSSHDATAMVVNSPFYWDGITENVFEVRKELNETSGEVSYNIYVNDTLVGVMPTEKVAKFPDGKAYMCIYVPQNVSGTGTITIKSITSKVNTAPTEVTQAGQELGTDYILESGSVLYNLNGISVSSVKAVNETTPFTVVSKDTLSINGSTTNFALSGLGYIGNSFETVTLAYRDTGNKELRIIFRRTDNSSQNVSVAVKYFDGSSETVLKDFTQLDEFNYSGTSYNSVILEKTMFGATNITVNGQTLTGVTGLDEKLAEMEFAGDSYNQAKIAYTKAVAEGTEGTDARSATGITLVGFESSEGSYQMPENIIIDDSANANGANTKAYTDGTGKLSIYNSDAVAFGFRYGDKKAVVDSFGFRFRVDRDTNSFGNTTPFDVILSSVTDNWYTEGSAVIFRYQLQGDGTLLKVLVYKDGSETEVYSALTTKAFDWTGKNDNYIGLAYSADDAGWVVVDDAAALLPLETNAEFTAALDEIRGDFEDSIANICIQSGADKGTMFTFSRLDYYVNRGVAPDGWALGSGSAPVWGYFPSEGNATLASTDTLKQWATTMPSKKVLLDGFKIEFDLYGNEYGAFAGYISSGGWYSDAVNGAIGFEVNYISDGRARVAAKYDSNATVCSVEMDFNWGGRNTIEIKRVDGEFAVLVNGVRMTGEYKEEDEVIGQAEDLIAEKFASQAERFGTDSGTFQFWNINADQTFIIRELVLATPNAKPRVETYISDETTGKTYKVGEKISFDLSEYFFDQDVVNGDVLSYTASIGTIEGSIWSYTPTDEDVDKTVNVVITCSDARNSSVSQDFDLKIVKGDSSSADGEKGCGAAFAGAWGIAGGIFVLVAVVAVVSKRRNANG